MQNEPKLEQREQQPYVAIPTKAKMDAIGAEAGPLLDEVFGWLQRNGVEPAGPPFFRYVVIDMDRELQLEVGVPVATAVAGDGRVQPGVVPAGTYATVVHVGPYDRLSDTTAELLAWAEANGVTWQARDTDEGEAWAGRFEFYLTDPREEPDPAKLETELAFLVADDGA